MASRHITAGDLTPVTIKSETTYGMPAGDPIYYGDVTDGGNFTFKDTPNPYISWRYGSRSFVPDNYVNQAVDAAFSASLEVRDTDGWQQIITNAVGTGGTTIGDPQLPSRSEYIHVVDGATWKGRCYYGSKTDRLTISADVPGGIVKFEEDVMASLSEPVSLATAISAWTADTYNAVQWTDGIKIGSTDIYPQSFKLTISNNLERSREVSFTHALLEGRREIEFEADVWMEDLTYLNNDIGNVSVGNITIKLGFVYQKTLTLSGCKYMADGNRTGLIQDKQRQTIRIRAANLVIS